MCHIPVQLLPYFFFIYIGGKPDDITVLLATIAM